MENILFSTRKIFNQIPSVFLLCICTTLFSEYLQFDTIQITFHASMQYSCCISILKIFTENYVKVILDKIQCLFHVKVQGEENGECEIKKQIQSTQIVMNMSFLS